MKKIKDFIAVIIFVIAILLFGYNLTAQPTPVIVECTEGSYPEEISWEIKNCGGTVLLNGGAPFMGACLIPPHFQIFMHDNYGDGWNGAYLVINGDSFGFLSNVNWIDSIGTWPQNYTDTMIDVGCQFINIEELITQGFIPTKYYDLMGKAVIPKRNGIYIVTDGIIIRKVFININN